MATSGGAAGLTFEVGSGCGALLRRVVRGGGESRLEVQWYVFTSPHVKFPPDIVSVRQSEMIVLQPNYDPRLTNMHLFALWG